MYNPFCFNNLLQLFYWLGEGVGAGAGAANLRVGVENYYVSTQQEHNFCIACIMFCYLPLKYCAFGPIEF